MTRYRVTTPDTPRVADRLYADFEKATECDTIPCVRRLLAQHEFQGCTVHRKRRNHWHLIFYRSIDHGLLSRLTGAAEWDNVERDQ